jgi:sugar phosphate isomerase/epimerase
MKLSIVLSTQPTAFSALAYRGELEKNIAKIAALGYEGVELAVRDPRSLDVEALEAMLKDHSLPVPAIGTGQAYGEEGLSVTDANAERRRQAIDRLKSHVALASRFGAVVIVGLMRGQTAGDPKAYGRFVDAMQECAEEASRFDVRLAVEPICRYETDLVNTVAEGMELIERVNSPLLGLLLDTFHMNIEEPSIEESIRTAGDRIYHFHVADSNRWYPGAGHLDFVNILQTLRGVGYDGYLSAEILPLPDPDTSAAEAIRHMRSFLAELGGR